jgi:hypothetical protein
MITVEKSRSWRAVGIAAALLLMAAGGYWVLSPAGEGTNAGGKPQAGNGLWPGMGNSASVVATGMPDLNPSLEADGRPVDVKESDWNALQAALKKHPNGQAEASRIVSFLRYQKAFETWQNLDEQRDAARRHEMARAIMSELPDRLRSGEFTLVEVALMGSVLLMDMESDETKRAQQVDAWQAKVGTLVKGSVAEAQSLSSTHETEFKRRRAAAFEEWQAKTDPAERSPAKLAQAMDDLQRTYNAGASN